MTPFEYVFLWFAIVWTFAMCVIIVILTHRDLKSRDKFLKDFSDKVKELQK